MRAIVHYKQQDNQEYSYGLKGNKQNYKQICELTIVICNLNSIIIIQQHNNGLHLYT